MHLGNQATQINASQAAPEHVYAEIGDDYISVIDDDNQHVNHLEGDYLTPIGSFHRHPGKGGRTVASSLTPVTGCHQEGGQGSIKLPHAVPLQTHCRQPPWWAWLLMVIGLAVIVLLSIVIVTGNVMAPPEVKPADPKDCRQVYVDGHHASGVYRISPDCETLIDVYCEQQLDGGGWVVFQSRYDGSVDFYNDWDAYKAGFGNLTGEFWLGNENIHILAKQYDVQLKVELTGPDGKVAFADYGFFFVGNEAAKYRLIIGHYSGDSPPADNMSYHNGRPFSTKDRDHDNFTSGSCAVDRHGAWWFGNCAHSSLNGRYGDTSNAGLHWAHMVYYRKAMKATRMMLRKRH